MTWTWPACKHSAAAAAAAKLLQSCPTLCDPIDSSPPGSHVPGILQANTLEWVAIAFCSAWKWKVKVKLLSRIWLLVTPWTAAYQASPPMGFSRQEYCSLFHCLLPANSLMVFNSGKCSVYKSSLSLHSWYLHIINKQHSIYVFIGYGWLEGKILR